ncbi:MAG: hypothetical protein ACI9W4_000428 [Rhodothermales bacterium]|jgi:hypothetical protein
MFGIVNEDGTMSRLVAIDKTTGAFTDLTDLDVENVEGLGFSADGTLLGVRGDTDRKVVVINQTTGVTTVRAVLGTNGGSDYESIACLTDSINKIAATVFKDVDYSGVFDNEDIGSQGARLSLFRDVNGDGHLDGGDLQVGEELSGPAGYYVFDISAKGHFLVSVDIATLPDYSVLTTTDLHTASVFGFGGVDNYNGFNGPSADVLTKLPATGGEIIIGAMGTVHLEAIMYQPSTKTLFAADSGRLDSAWSPLTRTRSIQAPPSPSLFRRRRLFTCRFMIFWDGRYRCLWTE